MSLTKIEAIFQIMVHLEDLEYQHGVNEGLAEELSIAEDKNFDEKKYPP